MSGSPTVLLLCAAVLTLLCGAVLSAAEAALTRMTRAAADDLLEEGRRGARRVIVLAERRASVLTSVGAVRVAVDMLAAVLLTLGIAGVVTQWWLVLILSVALNSVLLGLVVGISPRSFGRRAPDSTLLALAGLLLRIDSWGAPWRWVNARWGRTSAMTDAELREAVSQDLREMIDEIGESESIDDTDREMMRSVVELGQTLVRELMVPRTDMVTIDYTDTAADAMSLFVRSGYSRVPVIGEDSDDVRGILYLKDVVRRLSAHPDHDQHMVAEMARDAVFVPEMKLADDLLRDMQQSRVHIVLTVDEYGGTAGLVTLEDLLEEVVGELTDEHDRDELTIEDLGEGRYRIPARLGLDDIEDLFDCEIEDDDVDTAGGLLTKAVGRVPLPGAEGEIHGLHLVADTVTGRRRQLATIIASRCEPAPGDPLSDDADSPTYDGGIPNRKAHHE